MAPSKKITRKATSKAKSIGSKAGASIHALSNRSTGLQGSAANRAGLARSRQDEEAVSISHPSRIEPGPHPENQQVGPNVTADHILSGFTAQQILQLQTAFQMRTLDPNEIPEVPPHEVTREPPASHNTGLSAVNRLGGRRQEGDLREVLDRRARENQAGRADTRRENIEVSRNSAQSRASTRGRHTERRARGNREEREPEEDTALDNHDGTPPRRNARAVRSPSSGDEHYN